MAVVATRAGSAAGYYEPSCVVQFLPACPRCHGKHPLTYLPARPAATCPDCGFDLPPPPPESVVPTVITGGALWARLARSFLAIGAWLRALSKRM